jgi:DNA invertase Pin-like site-specific DNA recombinase
VIIGYIRPMDEDQDSRSQVSLLQEEGCQKIYVEAHLLPKRREELEKILEEIGKGDKIIISKLHVIADSSRHLVEVMERIEAKKASLYSIKEGIDTSKPLEHSFLDLIRCFVDFQSDTISQKTKQGITEAKEKGMVAGRPRKSEENVQKAIEMYQSKKYNLAEIKAQTGISKSTLYRYLES